MLKENGQKFNNLLKLIKVAISALFVFINSLVDALSQLLYGENTNQNKPRNRPLITRKINSLLIMPPRRGNQTERAIFSAGIFPTQNNSDGTGVIIENSLIINTKQPLEIKYALLYSQPEVHAAIYWFKYKRDQYATELLADLLFEEILEAISNTIDDRRNIEDWIVSPAPSTSYLSGEKKWDHCSDILNVLKNKNLKALKTAGSTNFIYQEIFTVSNNIILSKNKIENNKKLSRKSRIQNSNNKFALNDSWQNIINDQQGLIIFDDVTTTGSTLQSLGKLAAETKKIKKVILIAIAH